jgi:hypothetical protein
MNRDNLTTKQRQTIEVEKLEHELFSLKVDAQKVERLILFVFYALASFRCSDLRSRLCGLVRLFCFVCLSLSLFASGPFIARCETSTHARTQVAICLFVSCGLYVFMCVFNSRLNFLC